jgi:glycosyltransferase involved in cell wall biosynthesis
MRVLMVSKACLVGSYQTKLEEIAKYDDVELAVIVPPAWRDPAGEIRLERSHTQGYQLFVDPIRLNGHFHIHYYPKLKHRMQTLRPDILHMDEEPYNLATWLAVRNAQDVGAKSLFFSWQNIGRSYPFPFNAMEKQVLNKVDYAIMGNDASEQIWRQKGYKGPSEVIPQFGVDPDLFKASELRDLGRTFIIGSAARRLVPEKGIDLLIEAVSEMSGIWQLHIAGDGPERPYLERLAHQFGIGDRVFFDGPVPSAEMPAYLGQLDVLVVPSRTLPNWKEQFGRILVEAMSCQVAVIGSDSGEIPNVIGSAGLVFPEDDVDALRRQLGSLQQDPDLLQKLRLAGRKRVLSSYTQKQVAARTVEVYRRMVTTDSTQVSA